MVRLEKMLDAFGMYEDYLSKKSRTRDRNRARHAETQEVTN